jgi:hypothetical protein
VCGLVRPRDDIRSPGALPYKQQALLDPDAVSTELCCLQDGQYYTPQR